MKAIVLNYHFPPDPSMGGLRWAGISRYLARAGHEIHVVTSGSHDATEQTQDGVTVHRRFRRRTLNDVYRKVAARKPESTAGSGAALTGSDAAPAAPGVLDILRGELSALLAFPDYSRGWGVRALRATAAIARTGDVSIVVSSGPPHLVHLVGTVVSGRYGVPHVIDLRDPWATHKYDASVWSGVHNRHIGKWALPRMERWLFSHANLVIANTLRLRDLLVTRYPDITVEWVPNGVDLEALGTSSAPASFPGLSLAYTGTLYGGRDLEVVFRAFSEFLSRHPEARTKGSRIRVAGYMDSGHAARFNAQRREAGLEDVVEHLGSLPRPRALDLARASSLSLVLAQNQELQVPGKIYELAAVAPSVLVLSEQESASGDEARRLGVHWADPADVSAMLRVFEEVWSQGGNIRREPAQRVTYEHVAGVMYQVLAAAAAPNLS